MIFNLMPLKAMIEADFGKVCDEAMNGLVAVEMYYHSMTKTCCNVRYKIIFTDIQMPEMDGIAELTLIKHHEATLRQKNPTL